MLYSWMSEVSVLEMVVNVENSGNIFKILLEIGSVMLSAGKYME